MSENTTSISKKRLSPGKYYGLMALSDERGVIAALAMDQRGSLKKTLASAKGHSPGGTSTEAKIILILWIHFRSNAV